MDAHPGRTGTRAVAQNKNAVDFGAWQKLLGFLSLPVALAVVAFLYLSDEPEYPPIYDVQMHYNAEAWRYFRPKAIIATLEKLDVVQAAVSSTPNDLTFKLRELNASRIVAFASLYRRREDRNDWVQDAGVYRYLKDELARFPYVGIGEIHLAPGQLTMPIVRQVLALGVERGLVLNIHAEAPIIAELCKEYPDARILWAHAGMTASVQTVGNVLDRCANVRTELSHRPDVAPDGVLAPAWRDLFLRYPDRFMVGSGTYTNEFWYQFRYVLGHYRRWLAALPAGIAERIGYKNATDMFSASASAQARQRSPARP